VKSYFSEDFLQFLSLLQRYQVRYLIVGGEAVIFYGHARLTGDIDIFYERSAENAAGLFAALDDFWSGDTPGIRQAAELLQKGMVFQFGMPPNRIDLINEIESVRFEKAWSNKTKASFTYKGKKSTMYYIGLGDLIKNKRAIGRNKDKEDLRFLAAIHKRRKNK
jgi:hypothetical protein